MRIFISLLVVTFLNLCQSSTLHRNKRWMQNSPDYVAAPGSQPLKLDDPRRQRMMETFSDSSQGLTVIKDPNSNIKACFITDLDPEFSLSTLDKLEIMDAQEPLIINNPMKFRDLQTKAGPMITKLCSRLHIFWLNEAAPLAPLSMGPGVKAPPSLVKAPPSLVKAPPSLVKSPPSLVKAPPSLVKSPPGAMRVPPPLNQAEHHEVDVVQAPGAQPAHVMRTPPPLHKAIRAPPPL